MSCALKTGLAKRVLDHLGQYAHDMTVDMTLPTFLVHAAKTNNEEDPPPMRVDARDESDTLHASAYPYCAPR